MTIERPRASAIDACPTTVTPRGRRTAAWPILPVHLIGFLLGAAVGCGEGAAGWDGLEGSDQVRQEQAGSQGGRDVAGEPDAASAIRPGLRGRGLIEFRRVERDRARREEGHASVVVERRQDRGRRGLGGT